MTNLYENAFILFHYYMLLSTYLKIVSSHGLDFANRFRTTCETKDRARRDKLSRTSNLMLLGRGVYSTLRKVEMSVNSSLKSLRQKSPIT